jgi:hypothetical protein
MIITLASDSPPPPRCRGSWRGTGHRRSRMQATRRPGPPGYGRASHAWPGQHMVTCPAREPDQRSHARILARRRTELPFGCGTDSRAGRRGVATERRLGERLSTQRYASLATWQPRLRAQRMVGRPEYLYIAVARDGRPHLPPTEQLKLIVWITSGRWRMWSVLAAEMRPREKEVPIRQYGRQDDDDDGPAEVAVVSRLHNHQD